MKRILFISLSNLLLLTACGLLHQRTYLQIRKFRIVSIQQFLQMRKILR